MLDIQKKYEKGMTVYFECLYRSLSGFATQPEDPLYEITDVKGTIMATGTPLKRKDGFWYCFYTPTERGDFLLAFSGKVDGNPVMIKKKFKVVETRLT